ncbi:hypothetical protein LXT12_23205 [Pelomonas sp. P7]|uniref:Uncharacterized protein n=1 Tax=Pelomonas caseinilytica TaxID=2906763 RepID=A0ABS8XSI5_9BURK|nr:hypothetical protein [Pelomonas sp. P7]MCE4540165.1 hypothetical protein [Pelomonas sp. P7]
MDPTLSWLLLIAVAVLILAGAVRFDWLALRWRELLRRASPPDDGMPPPPRGSAGTGFKPHDAPPPHRPAFHRSGRRH